MWKALKCIKDLVDADTVSSNLYSLALAANAFAVAGDKALRQKILERLDNAAIISGTKDCGERREGHWQNCIGIPELNNQGNGGQEWGALAELCGEPKAWIASVCQAVTGYSHTMRQTFLYGKEKTFYFFLYLTVLVSQSFK